MAPWSPYYEFLLSTTTNLTFTTNFELVYHLLDHSFLNFFSIVADAIAQCRHNKLINMNVFWLGYIRRCRRALTNMLDGWMFAHRDLVDTFTSFKSKNDFTGAVIGQLKRNHIAESLVRINAAVTVYVGVWQLVTIFFFLSTRAKTENICKLLFNAEVVVDTNTKYISVGGM